MENLGYAIWMESYWEVTLGLVELLSQPNKVSRREYLEHHQGPYGADAGRWKRTGTFKGFSA